MTDSAYVDLIRDELYTHALFQEVPSNENLDAWKKLFRQLRVERDRRSLSKALYIPADDDLGESSTQLRSYLIP